MMKNGDNEGADKRQGKEENQRTRQTRPNGGLQDG